MDRDTDTTGQHPAGSDMYPPPPPPPPPPAAARRGVIGRRAATAAVAGGLIAGGIAGGYVISHAASSPSAAASPSAGSGTSTPPWGGLPRGFGGAGPAAHTEDLQQVAAAIGISESQLQTELSAGKTIAAVAKEHNVAVATVISTLVNDENAEVDAAVKAGEITQAQATQLKADTTQRVTDLVNGTMPAHGPGGPGGLQPEDLQVVATAIGLNTTQLQTELAAGKTIAAVAAEHHVTTASVISAWAAAENSEIDQRVASGQITSAEGTQMKAMTTQRITDAVNGTRPSGPPGGPWGGPGGFGGFPTR